MESIPTHRQCYDCKQILPRAHFKTLLSKLESIRRGGSGIIRMSGYSPRCRACRALLRSHRPKKLLTPRKLTILRMKGAITPQSAEMQLKEYEHMREMNKSRRVKKAIATLRSNRWLKMVRAIGRLLVDLRSREQYRTNLVRRGELDQEPITLYYQTYIRLLVQVRDKLEATRVFNPTERRPSKDSVWQEFFGAERSAAVWRAYRAIPREMAFKLGVPYPDTAVPEAAPSRLQQQKAVMRDQQGTGKQRSVI